jgi:hypothetical protein
LRPNDAILFQRFMQNGLARGVLLLDPQQCSNVSDFAGERFAGSVRGL